MEKANNIQRFFIKKLNQPTKVYKYALSLERWAEKYLKKTSAEGYILGVSGGVDSALAFAMLSKIPNITLLPVFIDIESLKSDREDAEELCKKFNVPMQYIDLTKTYKYLVKEFKLEKSPNAKNNLKVRLRTLTLYTLANRNNLLTVGTTNADETLVGYFTKFGDNACDIMLLCHLLKSHIRYLAKEYGVPDAIINKKPSAGLSAGQTDEYDIGVTYDEMDHYLCYAYIDPIQEAKINTRYTANKHKQNGPAKPPRFLRWRNSK